MLIPGFSAFDPFPTSVATSATIGRVVVPRGGKVGLVLPQTYAAALGHAIFGTGAVLLEAGQ